MSIENAKRSTTDEYHQKLCGIDNLVKTLQVVLQSAKAAFKLTYQTKMKVLERTGARIECISQHIEKASEIIKANCSVPFIEHLFESPDLVDQVIERLQVLEGMEVNFTSEDLFAEEYRYNRVVAQVEGSIEKLHDLVREISASRFDLKSLLKDFQTARSRSSPIGELSIGTRRSGKRGPCRKDKGRFLDPCADDEYESEFDTMEELWLHPEHVEYDEPLDNNLSNKRSDTFRRRTKKNKHRKHLCKGCACTCCI